MQIEQNFTCWYEGQDEGDGKDITAPNPKEAARMAVDIWRHENVKELSGETFIVYLKDENGVVSKVHVHSEQKNSHLLQ